VKHGPEPPGDRTLVGVQRTTEELAAGLDAVRAAPADAGTVELIVVRPEVGVRLEPPTAELTVEDGVVGDSWRARGSRHTADGAAEVGRQLTIMNARATALVAGERSRWALAGDQLYVDLDISETNLPAGTQIRLGPEVVVEISVEPHTGCAKFMERFGKDAARFVNGPDGRQLRLRGVNARVVEPGRVAVGDFVTVLRRPVGPAPVRSASH
jgi:hypothetical protein